MQRIRGDPQSFCIMVDDVRVPVYIFYLPNLMAVGTAVSTAVEGRDISYFVVVAEGLNFLFRSFLIL